MSTTAVIQAQVVVEQLRHQATLERIRVSETSQNLIRYVAENEQEDPLVNPSDVNPFKEKRVCAIL